MKCIRIAVGSTNPCKLDAVRQAFQEAFSMEPLHVIVTGYDVQVRSQASVSSSGRFITR